MLAIFSAGACLWFQYGLVLHSWPIILTNFITLLLTGAILVPSCAIEPNKILKKSASVVLASFRPSTGTRPPHQLGGAHRRGAPYSSHRAPQGYASDLHSLRPWWTASLSILLMGRASGD
jgi:hypothetical protein